MGTALLAVANIRVGDSWQDAGEPESGRPPRSRDIIRFVNQHFRMTRSEGSYDDVRRRDLKHPILAGFVVMSAADPAADRNDGTRGFGLAPEFLLLIRCYGTGQWAEQLERFNASRAALEHLLAQRRKLDSIPVTLPQGVSLTLSPGCHNALQRQVVEKFLSLYGFGAEVLYLGDAANKHLYFDETRLKELNFFEIDRGDLPDVVAYSSEKNWLYLVEAVHSSGPIGPERLLELKRLTSGCKAPIVYVTAFLTRAAYQKWAGKIAWETEVWIAEAPEHLIHPNGDKFLGPYRTASETQG